ncbi:hypothetical protein DN757_01070 [Paenibacillus silvae]|uniref:Uncharacterized protein n=1 Tax=Paenibacillus silvae TaxID=1325358 RepID=A0A2W6PHK0_9BACL|nr:hypothetical protein DN757_01070 [Paenibacillus silvae]
MRKINVLQPQQLPEYTCLDDRRLVLNTVMQSIIKETASQKVYIPNDSLTNSYNNKQSSLYAVQAETSNCRCDTREMRSKNIKLQQNIWHSHVLQRGARNQRWFDKLQDYRNGV